MRTLLLPLVVGLALGTAPAGAQAAGAQAAARPAADSGPAAVALQSLRALLAQDWQTSATLTDPAELARTKAAFLPLLARDSTGALAHRLLGVPPQVRLATLPDAEFSARLYAFFVRTGSRGTALARLTDAEVLAVAEPFPDTAYVVYRWLLPPGERPIRGAQVVQLQRDGGRWWLHMLADFESLREVLSAR